MPQYYLDGMLLSATDPLDVINPHHIEAIEAYPGAASVPQQFNATGSACGVILLWSRSGG